MNKIGRSAISHIAVVWMLCDMAFADESSFEIRLKDNRISPGRQTYCEMIFDEDVPPPETPFVENLNIRYAPPDRRKGIADQLDRQARTHVYKIIGQRNGSYTIGPLTFEHNGRVYRSNSVTLSVEAGLTASIDEGAEAEGDDISKHIFLVLDAPNTTIFVNERAPITLSLWRDWFNVSDIIGGEIEGDDLIFEEFREEDRMIKQGGVEFKVVRRISAFSAPMAGQYTVRPTTVSMNLAYQGAGSSPATVYQDIAIPAESEYAEMFAILNKNARFYKKFIGPSGRRNIKLNTEPVKITVLPFPEEAKPADFSGAIGDFSFDLSADTAEVAVGGQITLTMTIKGSGSYGTISIPHMKMTRGIRPYEPRVARGGDAVIYEQAIRIQSADVKEIPPAAFTFFNPALKKYVSLTKGPIPIRVTTDISGATAPGAKAQGAAAEKEWVDELNDAIRPSRRKTDPSYLNTVFMFIESIPIFIIFLGIASYGIIRYFKAHPLYVASFVASRRAYRGIEKAESLIERKKTQEFYEHIFRLLQAYLGTKRLMATEGITGHIADEIDSRKIEQEVIDKIKEVFYRCYIARYAHGAINGDEMKKTLNAFIYTVDRLDREVKI